MSGPVSNQQPASQSSKGKGGKNVPNVIKRAKTIFNKRNKSPEDRVRIHIRPSNEYFDVRRDQILLDEWGRNNVVPGVSEYDYHYPYPHVYESCPPSLWTPKAMANVSNDASPDHISPARKFVLATYLGEQIGALKFRDRIMNLFAEHLHPNSPLNPHFVAEVYAATGPGLVGLKKLLIDYHIWCRDSHGYRQEQPGFAQGSVPAIGVYPQAFRNEVVEVEGAVGMGVERVVGFGGLWGWLRDEGGGEMKCRYHNHYGTGYTELCYDRIT
ncbi:hypothetical protein EJ04DRAFT_528838 [Polyplosphaeria fusca]|uniref:Uncharacterized protein n=1 Tax=Polyplosphaeria fusca TaxID=682080 RepID=A0A9P4QNP9_9PLEO|nr:hypothetical protein EJ04DRAFT_528838 [Polyplosphaeria fusca]